MSTKSAFRPRARLVAILGEHLISDQAVGLVELVKNSYDADARHVSIALLSLHDPAKTTVLVADDGVGMTLDDVHDKWLSPAVDHKERAKHARTRTPMGRLPIGEKGVGRFAAHQMGRRLELVTRAAGHDEVVLAIDWNQFEDGTRFLDEVRFDVRERPPEVFMGERTGTRMTMHTARMPWDARLLAKVHRALRRLQSPLQSDEKQKFAIHLACPEYPEFENVDVSDVLDRAHYEFRVLVSPEGSCDYEYECKHPAMQRRLKTGTIDLTQMAEDELQGESPQSGPFWMNLYVWDRSKDHLQTSGVSRRELDAQCGVSLFRDGLRVLPYGEPGDDWLYLDQERIQAPAERIGNNQVIGLIHVDQTTNLQLRDKTNREGLIENPAFLDLRALARAAIRLFTTHWKGDRPRPDRHGHTKEGSVAHAKEIALSVRASARDDIEVQVPTSADPPSIDAEPSSVVMSQRRAIDELIGQLDGVEQDMRSRDHRLSILLHLAATGLAAERVVHEFGRQVVAASEALRQLRLLVRADARTAEVVKAVESCLQTLRNEFRVLAPYEAVQRSQKVTLAGVREAAQLALQLNRGIMQASSIDGILDGGDFEVDCRAASLVQVLDNLVHNACYWTSTISRDSTHRIGLFLNPDMRRITVADSGPGIHDEAVEHLFDPFFTMKTAGKGLGLFISRELAAAFGGTLRIASNEERAALPSWACGAALVLNFGPVA